MGLGHIFALAPAMAVFICDKPSRREFAMLEETPGQGMTVATLIGKLTVDALVLRLQDAPTGLLSVRAFFRQDNVEAVLKLYFS